MGLIHSDLRGPMQTKTPRENKYFLTLIDDYSRFPVVRLMKSKDEVTEVIKKYVAAMTSRFGRKLTMILRTVNGREYISQELEVFLRKEGAPVYRYVHATTEWSDGKEKQILSRNGKVYVVGCRIGKSFLRRSNFDSDVPSK